MVLGTDDTSPKAFKSDSTVVPDTNRPHFFPENHIEAAFNNRIYLGLAHRRLSIIDLSVCGHQPMSTSDGRYWIVHNGEVYNFAEIRSQIESVGETFISQSDTEVILKAYRRWGEAALVRFNGMFAFAIWDNREKRLFCARDRIGIKPFYFVLNDKFFLFASDIKTIIASGLYRSEIDPEGFYHNLSFGVAPRPMTAFKNVRALEPGCWMTIDTDGQHKNHRYWNVPVGTQDKDLTEAVAADMLEDALQKSIRLRLIADVPVGTFMSGGIDSTTVAAIAARNHPGITAFTLTYESAAAEHNEVEQARATADMHDMKHVVLKVKAEAVMDHIEEMILCYEEPYYTLSPNFIISKLVAENNFTAVLNGLGGDELFAGYPWYTWLPKWRLARKLRPIIKPLASMGHRWRKLDYISGLQSADRLHSALLSINDESDKRSLLADSQYREFNSIERIHELYVGNNAGFTDDLEAFAYMDIKNYIGNHQVNRLDQFTMRFSIEGRFPLLDHNLVETAFKIPGRLKIQNGEQKYILRKVASKYIHRSCLDMKKKGFNLPMPLWIGRELQPLVRDKIESLKKRRIFDSQTIDGIYRSVTNKNLPYYPLWQLVAIEFWLEKFLDPVVQLAEISTS